MTTRALFTFLACGLVFAGVAQSEVPYQAAPRTDENSRIALQQLLEKKTRGKIDVYFLGDSITRRWGATDAYQIWADALKPIFTELLGPPAAVDHAPPPTGDPSATSAPTT